MSQWVSGRGRSLAVKATLLGAAWLGLAANSEAGELRYQPTNPHFGGNAFNGAVLLQTAQIQNPFQKSNGGSGGSSGGGGSGDGGVPAINFPEFNFSTPGTTAIIIGPPTTE